MGESNEREGLWTAEQVADYLHLHPQTVYAKSRKGEIPSYKIGTALRFKPAEVREWADQNARPVEPEAA